ncbi:HAD family acid phosphatase [Streptomyces paludis]|uniref:Hydrolase n=1 Tax=Streptomyces paludis TaxID=2282738 RepID=A0A345HLP9_9ACTN|nr:HAD family acid phosphatase [Streptomyces paludis]AXG77623.1 hydrolase [Streptomyces paludis]
MAAFGRLSSIATTAALTAALAAGTALPALAAAPTATPAATTAAAAAAKPDYATWQADIAVVLDEADAYVAARIAAAPAGEKPAIVLDIDNTSLETDYSSAIPTPAIRRTLALANFAHARGVKIFFVSARPDLIQPITEYNLKKVGYPVDGLYSRSFLDLFTEVSKFKTAQRVKIEKNGYTIIANIGNNTTDLTGGHAERTFKLPDYDGQLS